MTLPAAFAPFLALRYPAPARVFLSRRPAPRACHDTDANGQRDNASDAQRPAQRHAPPAKPKPASQIAVSVGDKELKPPIPPPDALSYSLQPGEVGVRFINTPSGEDVIAAANPGDSLLNVGDTVGVHIPRACQSGLCGSCTCDVLDATHPDGRQTIRACQAGVVIPDGGPELVVDVERMKTVRAGKDPMARFQNLDTEYVAGAAPKPVKKKTGDVFVSVDCADCKAEGEVVCFACDGEGREMATDGELYTCSNCLGMGLVRCATCQGTGSVKMRN